MENKNFYIPERMFPWSAIKLNENESISFSADSLMGSFFIPVFDTETKCKEAFPDCGVIIIRTSI